MADRPVSRKKNITGSGSVNRRGSGLLGGTSGNRAGGFGGGSGSSGGGLGKLLIIALIVLLGGGGGLGAFLGGWLRWRHWFHFKQHYHKYYKYDWQHGILVTWQRIHQHSRKWKCQLEQ